MRLLPVAAILLLVAGCVTPSSTTDTGATPPAAAGDAMALAPHVDAAETLALLKTFSEAYPYRQSGGPTHAMSRDDLAGQFESAGLEVVRQDFESSVFRVVPLPMQGQNVIGIKWGADREHWIVVGAHYDVTEGAVYGTYDDGSGTILVTKLAEAFAHVPTNRTIAFIEFDQEERGLIGSAAFVQAVTEGTFDHPVTIDGMIDLDMVGITWPHPAHLICWENSAHLESYIAPLANATGMPAENLEFREPRGGSSDGASFIAADIPTAYFWSDWDDVVMADGTPVPQSYPFWHQADTYEGMVVLAGDEPTLTAGFQTVLDIVSPLLLHMAGGMDLGPVEASGA
ncbi:MAG TPA: M28 family peptidase [Candidatus Thermoplasmatota archaeon]|nr:M28 family peptidase [Candidatus Thermoplasmatota archaeon]